MTSLPLSLVRDSAEDARQALVERYGDRLFLTVSEGATVTRTDPRTFRRGIELGQIPAVHIGTTVRIPAAPFWRLCGLDPETFQVADPDSASEVPGTGTPLESTHALSTTGDRHHEPHPA